MAPDLNPAPMATFPEASLRSRTVGFPESGSDLGNFIPLPAHSQGSLNAGSCTPRLAVVCIAKLRPIFNGTPNPGSVSGDAQGPPSAQGPFARSRCYPSRRDVTRHVGGNYPAFFARTDPCARPKPSRRLRSLPWSASLCRLSPVPAGRWPFPTLSPQSLYRSLDPYPAAPLRYYTRY